jgi:hypothetical protein
MISIEKDAMDYSSKRVDAIYFSVAVYGYRKNKDGAWTFAIHDQLHEISSLESVIS